jgi:PAS domain-containing protein
VAGQVFLLQVVVVLLLVLAAVVALVLQVQHDSTQEARTRSLAVAATFAHAPGTAAALTGPDPTAVLQPEAEAIRKTARVDFVVAMDTHGVRYTHPVPDRIGKKFVGTIEPAVHGRTVVEEIKGTIGPLVQAVVPVRAPDGTVVGLVAAGITTKRVGGLAERQLPVVLAAAGAGLALATAGTALVSRRLMRQTHGLGPGEMARMYEHHDAVLHSVREGVIIIGDDGELLLANDEAHRLLGLPEDAERRPVTDLGLDPGVAWTCGGPPRSWSRWPFRGSRTSSRWTSTTRCCAARTRNRGRRCAVRRSAVSARTLPCTGWAGRSVSSPPRRRRTACGPAGRSSNRAWRPPRAGWRRTPNAPSGSWSTASIR